MLSIGVAIKVVAETSAGLKKVRSSMQLVRNVKHRENVWGEGGHQKSFHKKSALCQHETKHERFYNFERFNVVDLP